MSQHGTETLRQPCRSRRQAMFRCNVLASGVRLSHERRHGGKPRTCPRFCISRDLSLDRLVVHTLGKVGKAQTKFGKWVLGTQAACVPASLAWAATRHCLTASNRWHLLEGVLMTSWVYILNMQQPLDIQGGLTLALQAPRSLLRRTPVASWPTLTLHKKNLSANAKWKR